MMLNTATLYLATVLIWGSTFFAITFQLGEVAAEVSIAYRFALAALTLMVWCGVKRLPMRFKLEQHLWMMAQGLMLFGLNYLVVYWATADLSSGLISVIFSTIVLMNIFNSSLFFRKRPAPSMIAGAVLGLVGIALVFLPEVRDMDLGSASMQGILLSLGSAYIASLGSMISTRNQQAKLPVVQTNAYSMAYGAIVLAVIALIQGAPFTYEATLAYTGSLIYLALFGSIIAFGSFLTLLGKIGPERASYAMVMFPIVGLSISTLFENYHWTLEAALGVGLVLMGNVLIIASRDHLNRIFRWIRYPRRHTV